MSLLHLFKTSQIIFTWDFHSVTATEVQVCKGTRWVNIRLEDAVYDPTIEYKWSTDIPNAEFVEIPFGQENGQQNILINIPSTVEDGNYNVFVKAEDACGTEPPECAVLSLEISPEQEAEPLVTFLEPQNTLVVLDNTAEAYQWGFENKSTLRAEVFPNATFQDLILLELGEHILDTLQNYYWVLLTYGSGCKIKAYLNTPSPEPILVVDSCEDIPGIPTSTQELDKTIQFRVRPNPNRGTFQLILDRSISGSIQYSVYNLDGRLLHKEELDSYNISNNGLERSHKNLGKRNLLCKNPNRKRVYRYSKINHSIKISTLKLSNLV